MLAHASLAGIDQRHGRLFILRTAVPTTNKLSEPTAFSTVASVGDCYGTTMQLDTGVNQMGVGHHGEMHFLIIQCGQSGQMVAYNIIFGIPPNLN